MKPDGGISDLRSGKWIHVTYSRQWFSVSANGTLTLMQIKVTMIFEYSTLNSLSDVMLITDLNAALQYGAFDS
jgi:hypothetical protein